MDASAKDYYYKFDSRGRKIYYSKKNGVVAKSTIPKHILDSIEECSNLDMDSLIKTKNGYLEELRKLQEKIKIIDEKIKNYDNVEDYKRKKEAEQKEKQRRAEAEERAKRHDKEREEYLRKLFEKMHMDEEQRKKFGEQPKPSPPKIRITDQTKILEQEGISNKKEWRQWLLKHHPDKCAQEELALCQSVIAAGRNLGF